MRLTALSALIVPVFCLAGACGYALAGRGNALPAHVRSIGVPQFVNQSTTADIDRVLTDAVRAELQAKGRYLVQPEATGVDAVLVGTVTAVSLQPVAFTDSNQVSRYQILTTASIEFRDVSNNTVIWSNPSFQARDEYDVTTSETPNDPSALFRQDANALDRMARAFARTVVTSIFEAF
jgi:outer membrane lipopolysaccharide assembly protein LptE/RlpB